LWDLWILGALGAASLVLGRDPTGVVAHDLACSMYRCEPAVWMACRFFLVDLPCQVMVKSTWNGPKQVVRVSTPITSQTFPG
jgi:hypothetical protein